MLPEHHVMKCIFHHHDAVPKKKMLGGVSFEGGMAGGAGKGSHTVSQADAQIQQPPFSDIQAAGIGIGADTLTAGRGTSGKETAGGDKGSANKRQKDTVNIIGTQDKSMTVKTAEDAASEGAVIQLPVSVAVSETLKEQPRPHFDYKKYTGRLKSGIQTLLKGMKQKAGKESGKQPKKKEVTGRKAVTKEEVYEIQINTAYLLDSYNKRGERSMLGKE